MSSEKIETEFEGKADAEGTNLPTNIKRSDKRRKGIFVPGSSNPEVAKKYYE